MGVIPDGGILFPFMTFQVRLSAVYLKHTPLSLIVFG